MARDAVRSGVAGWLLRRVAAGSQEAAVRKLKRRGGDMSRARAAREGFIFAVWPQLGRSPRWSGSRSCGGSWLAQPVRASSLPSGHS